MLVQPIEKSAGSQSLTGPTNGRVAGYDLPGGLRVIAVDGMGSISAHRGDKLLPPPIVKVALPLESGESRQLIVLKASAALEPIDLIARDADFRFCMRDSDFVPLDRAALLRDLDPVGRMRLVRQLLDTCRDLFHLNHDVGYGRFCRAIIAELSDPSARLMPEALVGQHLALVSAGIPPAIGTVSDLFIVGERGIATIPYKPLPVGRGKNALLLDRALAKPGAWVVAIGAGGFAAWRVDDLPELSFINWLRQHKSIAKPVRAFVLRCIGDQTSGDESLAALTRELELFQPAARRNLLDKSQPVSAALDLLVADGTGGVFVKGWVRDPHQLVIAAELSALGVDARRVDDIWLRHPRPDIDKRYGGRPVTQGFVAYLPSAGVPRGQGKLELRLGSGATLDLLAPPAIGTPAQLRDAVLGGVPPESLTTEAIADVIAPAAAALHAQYLAGRKAPDVVQLGKAPDSPLYSIIIPLYRNLDYLRFQIGAFAIDPTMREAEIIYVLDSPEQRAELVHFLSGLHQLYGLPLTILVMSANFGYAAANNAAAAAAHGKYLLLLNSDVVPEGPGWLERLAEPLQRNKKAVASGARLLFDDHSLQHAGMRFARDAGGHWLNLHYHKGAPRNFAPAMETRAVPAVTGAALLVRADLFREVGGFTEDYIIGDYEDSDLCLKLRAKGGEIFYCPEAVLFHFERKSINRHAGYQRSVAGLYNRWLAGQRWSDTMDALMARFSAAEGGRAQ